MKQKLNEKIVIKRDGRQVPFQEEKIVNAINKAFKAVERTYKNTEIDGISSLIAKQISLKSDKIVLSVEDIQDEVEKALMACGYYDVAKAYVIYRHERTKIRDMNSRLVKKVLERVNSKVNERSNANVDEKSFSGREKETLATISKAIALEYDGLSKDVADAHKQMLIYQHDLDKAVWGLHNCLQINFQNLFTYGFSARNGDVRPPASFNTACQLVAVAFQCQSQVC